MPAFCTFSSVFQPPSGGCVLKPWVQVDVFPERPQPPSGGCVLKQRLNYCQYNTFSQPPSGGCVLKPAVLIYPNPSVSPAAFRRLCVETGRRRSLRPAPMPAAFRRLCVETLLEPRLRLAGLPAAFRRLCVETAYRWTAGLAWTQPPSGGCVLKLYTKVQNLQVRKPAAFRRLCVETAWAKKSLLLPDPSRLQAAVC